MPSVRRFSRVDTFELKVQIEKRLGSQKAEKYFNLVIRYLNLKLGKSEFDKLCFGLIGRENVRLHNELIIAIVKNAALSKIPPQKRAKSSKPPLEVNSVEDGEEVEQDAISPGVYSRNPVSAPFGITIHSQEKRKLCINGLDSAYCTETCHYSGHLPAANSLKNRLNHNLRVEGLDVSRDCVNLLNNGLDCFLKSVLKPSLELARSRSSQRWWRWWQWLWWQCSCGGGVAVVAVVVVVAVAVVAVVVVVVVAAEWWWWQG
ncbi:putative transcriptional coactivator Hfi1/Transcriptional adapter 1 [Helianthus annuus]|nr:putative transcriptional coactivator Hfi1/Transcriptional adapter 1 [Helianthus annuus]